MAAARRPGSGDATAVAPLPRHGVCELQPVGRAAGTLWTRCGGTARQCARSGPAASGCILRPGTVQAPATRPTGRLRVQLPGRVESGGALRTRCSAVQAGRRVVAPAGQLRGAPRSAALCAVRSAFCRRQRAPRPNAPGREPCDPVEGAVGVDRGLLPAASRESADDGDAGDQHTPRGRPVYTVNGRERRFRWWVRIGPMGRFGDLPTTAIPPAGMRCRVAFISASVDCL